MRVIVLLLFCQYREICAIAGRFGHTVFSFWWCFKNLGRFERYVDIHVSRSAFI